MVLTPLWGIGGQDIDFLCVAQKISLDSLGSLISLGVGRGNAKKNPLRDGSGL